MKSPITIATELIRLESDPDGSYHYIRGPLGVMGAQHSVRYLSRQSANIVAGWIRQAAVEVCLTYLRQAYQDCPVDTQQLTRARVKLIWEAVGQKKELEGLVSIIEHLQALVMVMALDTGYLEGVEAGLRQARARVEEKAKEVASLLLGDGEMVHGTDLAAHLLGPP